jgi:predicted nuclease with TOPRIM domain
MGMFLGIKKRRYQMTELEQKREEYNALIKQKRNLALDLEKLDKDLRKLNAEKYYLEGQLKGGKNGK